MKYVYWFACLEGIGSQEKRRLVSLSGCERELYFMTEKQLEKIPGIQKKSVDLIVSGKKSWDLEREYEKLDTAKMKLAGWLQEEYPQKLRNIYNPPYALFYRGKLPAPGIKAAALVGARMCSEYGRTMAGIIGKDLARAGVSVISGLAYGIDAAAHCGALKAERGADTFAVMGCGADLCYPLRNRELYQGIWKGGGILSEYPPGAKPKPYHFPMRNRIISGLSDAVIIVEAREKSGSLITADFALEQGKDVYAVPGRIQDTLSRGTNRLIDQGAGIFLSTEEFLKDLGIAGTDESGKQKLTEIPLEQEEWEVYGLLDYTPKNMEWLLAHAGFGLQELLNVLYRLERLGYIREIYKNYYVKIK